MIDNFQIIVTQDINLSELGDLIYRSYTFLMKTAYNNETLNAALPFITKTNPALVQSGKYYAAVKDKKLIACGGWSFENPMSKQIEEGTAHLRHFATLPEFCGKGIGTALYNFSKVAAQKADVRRFECYSSLNAVKFYEGVGFSVIKEEEVLLKKNLIFPCVSMHSTISGD